MTVFIDIYKHDNIVMESLDWQDLRSARCEIIQNALIDAIKFANRKSDSHHIRIHTWHLMFRSKGDCESHRRCPSISTRAPSRFPRNNERMTQVAGFSLFFHVALQLEKFLRLCRRLSRRLVRFVAKRRIAQSTHSSSPFFVPLPRGIRIPSTI